MKGVVFTEFLEIVEAEFSPDLADQIKDKIKNNFIDFLFISTQELTGTQTAKTAENS